MVVSYGKSMQRWYRAREFSIRAFKHPFSEDGVLEIVSWPGDKIPIPLDET